MCKEQPVIIHILSEQWASGESIDPIRLMSVGKLFQNAEQEWTISYKESEATGMEGTNTSLRLTKSGNIYFQRTGNVNMNILFESGDHFLTQMQTPYGPIDISVFTNEVKGVLSEKGGEITLAYSLNFPNQEKVSTRLNLKIQPEN